jgi:hypothetical protein
MWIDPTIQKPEKGTKPQNQKKYFGFGFWLFGL